MKNGDKLTNMHRDIIPEIESDKIACQQVLEEDHSVFSIQSVIIPTCDPCELTAASLLRWYLDYIRRCTFGLIQPEESPEGIVFRIAGTSAALIRFLPHLLEEYAGIQKKTLRIAGGLLVQPKECDRGQLDFIVEPVVNGTKVTLLLSDYCPIILGSRQPSVWRKWLYRLTQAYLHKVVTIRFLAMLYRKITGKRLSKGYVRVAIRQGRDI